MTTRMDEFGRVLMEERELRGLGMREAASQVGIGLNTWFRAEHGENIGADVLLKLVDWLEGDLALFTMPQNGVKEIQTLQRVETMLRQIADHGKRAEQLAEKIALVRKRRSFG